MTSWHKEDWTPKSIDEWREKQQEVYAQLDKIEILEPPKLEDGEIMALWRINQYYMEAERAFDELLSPKMKAEDLYKTACRWRENEYNQALIDVIKLRDEYPNASIQKAYAKQRAAKYQELVDVADILQMQIHSKRSDLWQFRKDLENAGHNARKYES